MSAIPELRPSPIAGTWYEGNPQALASSVDEYLDRAKLPELTGEIVAVIAPHAGHIYSGPVAGYAFAGVRGRKTDVVAIVSPMHHAHREPLLTTAHAAYSTPLGNLPVDRAAVEAVSARVKEKLGFGLTPVVADTEHSLEIELPFLQRALIGEFKLLPIMVHAVSPGISRALGEALAETLKDRNCLLVGSTDLSHFYSQQQAEILDGEMLRQIESFAPEGAFEAEVAGAGFACGLGAFTAVLWAARALGADTVKVLRHATSGDVTGEYDSVVGYGAAVVIKPK